MSIRNQPIKSKKYWPQQQVTTFNRATNSKKVRQKLPETPMQSSGGPKVILRPNDLPDIPSATNNHTLRNINSVVQELQGFALHVHLEVHKHITGCILCCKSYHQVLKENVTKYLYHSIEPVETVRDRHSKKEPVVAGVQYGVVTFVLLEVSQAGACNGIITKSKMESLAGKPKGNYCLRFNTKSYI